MMTDTLKLSERQHSSSLMRNPRITSVIHVSIKPPSSARSLPDNKQKKRRHKNSAILPTRRSCNKLQKSPIVGGSIKRSTNATSSARVTKVRRPLSQCRQNSWRSIKNSSQKSDYKNNVKTDSTITHHMLRTASVITNKSVPTNHIQNKESLGTVKDLTNPIHKYPHLAKDKKIKNLIEYCCRCSRRCAIMSLFSCIFLGIIIAIVLIILLRKRHTTVNKPLAFLRWNTTGVTLFGTTSIRGNTSNQFSSPFGLTLNSFNDLYIADRYNHRIQKCLLRELTCTTIAGQANAVRGTNMSDLNGPTYMYIDSNNDLYIADSGNHRVQFWRYGASYGTKVAGITSSSGSALNTFNVPYGIGLDSNTNTIYIADYNNHRVMKYLSGAVSGTVVAGGNSFGTNNTQLYSPAGLYFDLSTNSLIIANFAANNIVRWILGDNKWTIIAGDANGLNGNTSTLLNHPTSFIFDPMGNMYIADMFNHRIQMYLFDQSDGITIAGISGEIGNNSTMLYYPVSMVLDNQLNLYVTDSFNQRIQQFLRY